MAPSEQAKSAGAGTLAEKPNVGRGTVQILVARMFLLVSGFGVSVILARALGPAAFGIYGVIMSMLAWFERVISAGVPRATAMLLTRDASNQGAIEQSARILLLIVSFPLFGILWVSAPEIANYMGFVDGQFLIRIAALNIPAMAIYCAYDGIFQGLRRFDAQSLLQIAQSAFKFGGILVLLVVGLTLNFVFAAHVAATLLAVGLIAFMYKTESGRPSVSIMRQMVLLGMPMVVYRVALVILMSLSLWQLQSMASNDPKDVGQFVATLHLVRILMMVTASVSGVLYASMLWAIASSRLDLAEKYMQGAIRFALVLTVPACVLLSANSAEVLEFLYGEDYKTGGPALAIMCNAIALVVVFDVLFNALMAKGYLKRVSFLLVALIPVLYFLNQLWIPKSGAVGAAWASLVTMALGAAAAILFAWWSFGFPARPMMLLRVFFSGLVVTVISIQIDTGGLALVVELGGLSLVYFGLLWVTREVSKQDLHPFALWKRDRQ